MVPRARRFGPGSRTDGDLRILDHHPTRPTHSTMPPSPSERPVADAELSRPSTLALQGRTGHPERRRAAPGGRPRRPSRRWSRCSRPAVPPLDPQHAAVRRARRERRNPSTRPASAHARPVAVQRSAASGSMPPVVVVVARAHARALGVAVAATVGLEAGPETVEPRPGRRRRRWRPRPWRAAPGRRATAVRAGGAPLARGEPGARRDDAVRIEGPPGLDGPAPPRRRRGLTASRWCRAPRGGWTPRTTAWRRCRRRTT